jgi:hypothetical protein
MVDPFNSVGGYTVGIPPLPVLSANGQLTVPSANIGQVTISGDAIVSGTVRSTLFLGNFQGNIQGNIVVAGGNTEIMFNDTGNVGTNPGFTFNSATQVVTIAGDLIANSITLGSGTNEFSTSAVTFATTLSAAPDQNLHTIPAHTICSVDYTIIATDTVGNARQTSKLFASILGSEVGYFEYGTIDVPITSTGVGDFKVVYDSGNILLTVTPAVATNINYRIMVTSYKE